MTFADISLIAFAFTAGTFTFFAPCAYPLVPGYVSYYLGRSAAGTAPDGGRTTPEPDRWRRPGRPALP